MFRWLGAKVVIVSKCLNRPRDNVLSFFKQVTNEGGTDDSASYYVNLCRPLVPMPGKNCPPGSWACRIDGDFIQVSGLKRVA